jgi:cytochrome b561
MRTLIFESLAMFLLGGLVVLFIFFIRAAWRHAERNEKLTKENEELKRRVAELEERLKDSGK